MGHHSLPQRYLRKFQDPDELGVVWMHDKRRRIVKKVPIKVAAQRPKFYRPSDENTLNKEVEIPGGNAIDKLIRGQRIDIGERADVARYVATMMRRVPGFREWSRSVLPEVLPRACDEIRGRARWEARSGCPFRKPHRPGFQRRRSSD